MMKKIEISYILRCYFAWYLRDYLNDFPHDEEEEKLLENLIERMYCEPKIIMSFTFEELDLLYNSIEYACEIREFIPDIIIY